MIHKFLSLLEVYDTPFTKIRLGNEFDGGYVVLKELTEKAERLYSFGVSDDVSFELDLLKLNPSCSVRCFDHTVNGLPEEHENMIFVKQGLGTENSKDFGTLQTLTGQTKGSMLKLDIEWAEWEVLEAANDADISDFDQIIAEFHVIPVMYRAGWHTRYFTKFHDNVYRGINDMLFEKYVGVMEKLLRHYRIFHIHANNSLFPGEAEYPQLLELSLVNKKHVPNANKTATEFPVVGLDFPNKPYKPEIRFYPFPLHKDRGTVNV